jgi:formate dehydrogenase major subunit
MELTRRHFLKLSTTGAIFSSLGFDLKPALAEVKALKIARTSETHSTCPYCSVSCGVIIHTLGDRAANVTPTVVHIEGNPDHPINRGTLCPKGASLRHYCVNDRRLTKPLYRPPGATHWHEVDWDFAITEIASQIKDTRDRTFQSRDEEGKIVNRTMGIAAIGGCTDTNEMNSLLVKTMRAFGIVYLDQQSRL